MAPAFVIETMFSGNILLTLVDITGMLIKGLSLFGVSYVTEDICSNSTKCYLFGLSISTYASVRSEQ